MHTAATRRREARPECDNEGCHGDEIDFRRCRCAAEAASSRPPRLLIAVWAAPSRHSSGGVCPGVAARERVGHRSTVRRLAGHRG